MMADTNSALGEKLHQMALKLIDEVEGEEADVKVAAFKALSAFYIQSTKCGSVPPEEADAGGVSMKEMRQRVAVAGGAK